MSRSLPAPMEREAWELLRHTARCIYRFDPAHHGLGACGEQLLRRLLHLMAESHDRPACILRPVVQRCLDEVDFIDAAAAAKDHDLEHRDQLIDLILGVLEQVRQIGLRRGVWSMHDAAMPMFG